MHLNHCQSLRIIVSRALWIVWVELSIADKIYGTEVMYEPMETWKFERKEEKGGNRKKGRVSVTSAIMSLEMHLDRVSICQNKAASTAGSLMAVYVKGGEKLGWGRRRWGTSYYTAH